MRVAMYYKNDDVRVEEQPKPEIGCGEILVKVIASGICGSDVMEWYRIKKAPRVLGHEIAGEVVEVGSNVKKYKKGDRVFVSHHVPCNTCEYCLEGSHTACDTLHNTNFFPGGFSEYLRVPEINVDRGVFILPKEMSYDEGTLIEPLACCLRGQKIAGIKAGDSVLVIGSGISGIIHVLLAQALGAGNVIASDISDYRLEISKKLGADHVINAKDDVKSEILKCNNNKLIDHVILCTGAESALAGSLNLTERGGTVLFFAPTDPGVKFPLDINYIWQKNITLKTSYGAAPNDIAESIDILASKRLDLCGMITHKLPMNKVLEGFKLVSEAKESLKVIIEPHK